MATDSTTTTTNNKTTVNQADSQLLSYINYISDNNYKQLEAHGSILNILGKINFPLPSMRGWAISPDFALLLVQQILRKTPNFILETGSGVSTIIIGYLLKKIGAKGSCLISLEHDEKYYKESLQNLKDHKLQDYVDLIYAPLKEYDLYDKKWLWYDFDKVLAKDKINLKEGFLDMLVIDGPPGNVQPHSRFPAMSILEKYIAKNYTIILDDAARREEMEIIKKWQEMFKIKNIDFIDLEKGACVMGGE